MAAHAYVTVDVFTGQPFGGNPLAVVLDGRGLSDAAMQSIALEFNYSETTFVLPPADPANTAQVRIFTPRAELPFAGHPNVGTAFVLARRGDVFGKPAGGRLLFEEKAGLVPVEIDRDGGDVTGATLTAPQSLVVGATLDAGRIAAAVGLDPGEILTERHPPTVTSVGLPFVVVELASRAALVKAQPRTEAFQRYLSKELADAVHLYVRCDADDEADVRCRMFSPLHNIPEDPATGSANAALSGLLAALDPARDGDFSYRILQGVEMGRPSLLLGGVEKRGGMVTQVRIGGGCVAMMEGSIRLDS